jgi:hypothetical protein
LEVLAVVSLLSQGLVLESLLPGLQQLEPQGLTVRPLQVAEQQLE